MIIGVNCSWFYFNFEPKYKALEFVIFFALEINRELFSRKVCLWRGGHSCFTGLPETQKQSSAGAAVDLQLHHANPTETEA